MRTTFDLQIVDSVATLTLVPDDLSKPPTFDHPTLDDLSATLSDLVQRIDADGPRVLFVRSASPRFFCAGANINALHDITVATVARWVEHGHAVFAQLEDLPIPTVARVEGYALGGGLELALACDLIFASEAAQLGQTEALLGFVAGWGGSARLTRRVGVACAKELFFSARRVPAAEAAFMGLVDFCGHAGALEARCEAFASAVKNGSACAHAEHKRLVGRMSTFDRREVAQAEAASSVACLNHADTDKRLRAFLTARR